MYHGDWVSHMAQKHWRSWNCPFCPSINCSSPAILRFHVSLQHPNEVPPRQLDSFISLCGTFDFSRCRGTCPLCSVFDIKTSDQYQSHIDQHLEQLTASVFSNILDKTVIGESEASSKHSSISLEQASDVEPLILKRPSTDQTTGSTVRSPNQRRKSFSPSSGQLNLTSGLVPIPEPSQATGPITIHGATEKIDDLATSASEGIKYQPQSSLSPYSSRNNESTSLAPTAASIEVTDPGPDRSTPSVMLQSNQNDSPTSHNVQRVPFAGTPKASAVVYIWTCCYCGSSGQNAHTTQACVTCGVARCGNCYMEAHKVRI